MVGNTGANGGGKLLTEAGYIAVKGGTESHMSARFYFCVSRLPDVKFARGARPREVTPII
jgi:hypothetical protein